MSTPALAMRRLWAGAGVALAALLIVGCGGGSSSGDGTSGPAKVGGVLHTAVFGEPPSLVPSLETETPAIDVTAQINEPLLKLDESGKLEPLLATSYKHSPDGLTWTFNLRKGVKFSDGKPMTAKDVVFTLETERKSPYFGGTFADVDSVKELSPNSIQIKTTHPMAALLAALAAPSAGVVPYNFGGASEKDFAQNPVGTGPFMLKKWVHGQSLTLVKNPHYWQGGLPLADEVVFTIVEDEQSRLSQFSGGQIDVLPSTAFSQFKSLEQTPGTEVGNFGMYRFDYLGLNLTKPLFANRHAREAVNLAIDREGVNKAALGGYGEPAGSFLPPTLPYHADLPIQSQDLGKAKQLLSEAEQEGVDPTFTLAVLTGEAYAETAGQVIQQNLSEAGFKVTLQSLDVSALYEKFDSGETDAALAGFYASVQDPTEGASFYLEVVAAPNGVETKPLEKIAAEASAELNSSKRQALYAELQESVQNELQSVPIDYQPQIWLLHDNVTGFEVNPVGTPWLDEAGFTE